MKTIRCQILYPLAALAAILPALAAQRLEPANPKTNAKAREILNYLEGLPQKQEKRLICPTSRLTWPRARFIGCS